jgi:hypothetical protein
MLVVKEKTFLLQFYSITLNQIDITITIASKFLFKIFLFCDKKTLRASAAYKTRKKRFCQINKFYNK